VAAKSNICSGGNKGRREFLGTKRPRRAAEIIRPIKVTLVKAMGFLEITLNIELLSMLFGSSPNKGRLSSTSCVFIILFFLPC